MKKLMEKSKKVSVKAFTLLEIKESKIASFSSLFLSHFL